MDVQTSNQEKYQTGNQASNQAKNQAGNQANKLAMITGASSGLGWEFAECLAREHYDLILTARNQAALETRKEQLETKYGVVITTMPLDLSIPNAATKLHDQWLEMKRPLHLLINNAGFGDFGEYHHMDWETQANMIQLNIVALMQLTHLMLPAMVERNEGRIMNVASTAAFQSGPFLSTYYASKAFVLSFSEAIAMELKDTNITITALCPGPTRTNFVENAKLGQSNLFHTLSVGDAKQVVEAGYRGMLKGKLIVVPGQQNKVAILGSKLMPRWLIRRVVYRLNQKRSRSDSI